MHHARFVFGLSALAATLVGGGCWSSAPTFVPDPDRAKGLSEDPKKLVARADRLVRGRQWERPPPPGTTDRAIAALDKAMALGHPAPFEVLWRRSRAFFLMTEVVDNDKQKHIYGRRGVEAAQRALQLDDKRVEGHYFLALNTAKVAESTNNAKLIDSMVAAAQRAAEIDPRYDAAGPLRFLGKVYLTAPAWPVSVGSPAKAVEVLERAVALSPVPLNRVFLAEAYFHDEEYDRAEELLEEALEDGQVNRMAERWRREAQEYLHRINAGDITDPRTRL